jgi:phosphatidylserine decarboxylase
MAATLVNILAISIVPGLLLVGAYPFWRCYWFWRNPPRSIPSGEHFVSPADGTVVYVKRAAAQDPVIVCKQGKAASINDIAREDLGLPKILIGVFMSPLSVHYNRAPTAATVVETKQYPAEGKNLHMGSMHWRCLWRRLPIHANSPHITQNNRAVTRFRGVFRGKKMSYYVVQIGGGSVHGIDVFRKADECVEKGEIFGMIRIGSQVDLIVPDLLELRVRVEAGDRVRAGETVLIE